MGVKGSIHLLALHPDGTAPFRTQSCKPFDCSRAHPASVAPAAQTARCPAPRHVLPWATLIRHQRLSASSQSLTSSSHMPSLRRPPPVASGHDDVDK